MYITTSLVFHKIDTVAFPVPLLLQQPGRGSREAYKSFETPIKKLLELGPKGLPDFTTLQAAFTKLQKEHNCFKALGMDIADAHVWKKCFDVADSCKTCLKHVRESAKIERVKEKIANDWYHI